MKIRKMNRNDTEAIIQMMEVFYASSAVHSNGSAEIFRADVENCINDNPYLEGYVFEEADSICGYGMLAKSFSTEFGRPCIWIEDLYIQECYRGRGIGKEFLAYVDALYPQAVIRLEAEEENVHAVHVYKKSGFDVLPYLEMYKIKE